MKNNQKNSIFILKHQDKGDFFMKIYFNKNLLFLLITMMLIATAQLVPQGINYDKIIVGTWKYIIYPEGGNFETNQAGYDAAKNVIYAMEYKNDGTVASKVLKDNKYTIDTEKIINCRWSINSNKLTINYTWVPGGENYQDVYEFTLENNNKNALCVLVSSTHPDRISLIGKFKMFCEKI